MKKRVDRLKLRNYLTIGKPPIGPNELDPGIFRYSEVGRDPVLLPGVHAQIVNDIEMFCGNQVQRIKKFVLVGDALKPGNKNRTCELKVLVVINKDLMDIDFIIHQNITSISKSNWTIFKSSENTYIR